MSDSCFGVLHVWMWTRNGIWMLCRHNADDISILCLSAKPKTRLALYVLDMCVFGVPGRLYKVGCSAYTHIHISFLNRMVWYPSAAESIVNVMLFTLSRRETHEIAFDSVYSRFHYLCCFCNISYSSNIYTRVLNRTIYYGFYCLAAHADILF